MKLIVLVRTDLKLPKGKLAVQVAHAAVECALKTDQDTLSEWRSDGAKKVVAKVADEKELREFQRKAKSMKLRSSLISDAGKTTIAPGTVTVLGIGPDEESKIDRLTAHLKIL